MGAYELALVPGAYRLEISLTGFRTSTIDVTVAARTPQVVPAIRLAIGGRQQRGAREGAE